MQQQQQHQQRLQQQQQQQVGGLRVSAKILMGETLSFYMSSWGDDGEEAGCRCLRKTAELSSNRSSNSNSSNRSSKSINGSTFFAPSAACRDRPSLPRVLTVSSACTYALRAETPLLAAEKQKPPGFFVSHAPQPEAQTL
ncbi:hypothetical protein ACSSS7_000205 [Eimeria intestinalis]